MEISVISKGKSKGILLPDFVLKKYNLTEKIELVFEKDYILIKRKEEPKEGWENTSKEMHKNGEDILLIVDVFEDENFAVLKNYFLSN